MTVQEIFASDKLYDVTEIGYNSEGQILRDFEDYNLL